jgi:tetratricopeptide (TPR) repeat protein
MFLPGWINVVVRPALLMLAAGALTACGTLGSSPVAGAPTGATQDTSSPELQARYASLLASLQAGDAGAATELAAFSAENPELAGPLLNLGLARARAGDEAGARVLFERASTVCSHCGPVWNQLGILDRQQGQFTEAEKAYRHAIELEPDYAPTYFNLAVLYELYIPRPDLALENYERYLQMGGPAVEGQDVEKWVGDLRRRVGMTTESARAEGAS